MEIRNAVNAGKEVTVSENEVVVSPNTFLVFLRPYLQISRLQNSLRRPSPVDIYSNLSDVWENCSGVGFAFMAYAMTAFAIIGGLIMGAALAGSGGLSLWLAFYLFGNLVSLLSSNLSKIVCASLQSNRKRDYEFAMA